MPAGQYTRKFQVEVSMKASENGLAKELAARGVKETFVGQGTPIEVAALMCGQTEEFLREQGEALKETTKEARMKRLEKNIYTLVVNGLNNAGGTTVWTAERVRAELDKRQIDAIVDLVMVESGLERPNLKTPDVSTTLPSSTTSGVSS